MSTAVIFNLALSLLPFLRAFSAAFSALLDSFNRSLTGTPCAARAEAVLNRKVRELPGTLTAPVAMTVPGPERLALTKSFLSL